MTNYRIGQHQSTSYHIGPHRITWPNLTKQETSAQATHRLYTSSKPHTCAIYW